MQKQEEPKRIKLSVSSIKTYEDCPKKYWYGYIEKPPIEKKPWVHLEFGSCLHLALEKFHQFGGNGIAAPSGNRFGAVSPTNAEAVQSELGEFLDESRDLIIDGGQSLVGVESTIIDCTSEFPRILRPGANSIEMIFGTTGLMSKPNIDSKIRVSGSLEHHYSPKAKILLNGKVGLGEGFIALDYVVTPEGAVRLASPTTLEEYARILYATLREADKRGINRIVVISPEGDGLAIAIRDRLARAAR